MLDSYDYIVVGAGSSGCIVAGRLAKETCSTVLLIEAGPAAEENPDTMSADGFKYCFANDNIMLDRFSEKQHAMSGRSVYQGTGTTMGGSGSVNGMVYTRGDKADFDAWPEGWQWDDIAPAFNAVEEKLKPQHRVATTFTQSAIDAWVNTGRNHKDGLNDGDLAGYIGHNAMNYQGDRRSSSYMAYLHDQPLENLTTVNHCLTHKVLFENKRAVAVELEVGVKGGGKGRGKGREELQRINANKEIILCAGALETPKLLMLSGVGPSYDLQRHSIPLVLEQAYIGANLHDHPNVCLFYKGKQKLDFGYPQLYAFDRVNPNSQLMKSGQPDTCFAFFAAPITLHQSMHRMIPALALPRRLYPIRTLRNAFRWLIDLAFKLPALNNMIDNMYGIVVILGKPESRGRLRLQSADVRDQASIDTAYYQSDNDMKTMIKGIDIAQKMAADSSLSAWGSTPISGGGKTKNPDVLRKFIKGATMTTFHFCGTCKMGKGTEAPVDNELKLKGIVGLRVADASVIPEIPVSAINAPSMMIGHRAVDFILENEAKNEAKSNAKDEVQKTIETTRKAPVGQYKATTKKQKA